MNHIKKQAADSLGYNFIPKDFLPENKNEYYLRDIQNRSEIQYRNLTANEIETLVRNNNTSDNWNNFLVSQYFDPSLVQNCSFNGLIRIGKLEPYYLEYSNLRLKVGLYNSKIISSDFGDNVCIQNVQYLSHYIIGNEVMISSVNEIATTNTAKFGNGVVKEGEDESTRIYIELRNENGGRKIIPFNGMLTADAFLYSTFRDDKKFLNKLKEFTTKKFDNKRGYYGKIGNRTVIKNCMTIKDVWIGSDAYIKGVNKLKNVTINSDENRSTQIGEGCEIVNGIVGYGCRIFYGVKAVRFILASHSQLKYGARLINSYLGNNATISCCEVLNSLIYPAHEQHHNNSFLCAAMIMGQSNIAAGATIGSNHNSRAADGEIIAGRGFWPGLCVSLKHNSKFASYSIIAKGDFPAELNIPIPFSLISNDVKNDELLIMPAYWFMYNYYALARNEWKAKDRDKRIGKKLTIEYDYLAPDTINEIIESLNILRKGKIEADGSIVVQGFENSKRNCRIVKAEKAIKIFEEMIEFYFANQLIEFIKENNFTKFSDLKKHLITELSPSLWTNVGGQLIKNEKIKEFRENVKSGKITCWEEVHAFYAQQGNKQYKIDKLNHAYNSYLQLKNYKGVDFNLSVFKSLLNQFMQTLKYISHQIVESRQKDYTNPFRKMIYQNKNEMNEVLGKLEDNSFIQQELKRLDDLKLLGEKISRKIKP